MAAKDIFGRQVAFGGAFPADNLVITFGKQDANVAGAVVQRINMTYAQQVARLYELGSANFYYVGGRANGQAALDKVLGPVGIIDGLVKTYGDICSPNSMTITAKSGGCFPNGQAAGPQAIQLDSCVATQFGIAVQAQDAIITENLQLMVGWVSKMGGGQ